MSAQMRYGLLPGRQGTDGVPQILLWNPQLQAPYWCLQLNQKRSGRVIDIDVHEVALLRVLLALRTFPPTATPLTHVSE